jgi:hypothetical protein
MSSPSPTARARPGRHGPFRASRALVALAAAVAVAFVMPQRLADSEDQARHGGDEQVDRDAVTV